jgi:hypothetical protein
MPPKRTVLATLATVGILAGTLLPASQAFASTTTCNRVGTSTFCNTIPDPPIYNPPPPIYSSPPSNGSCVFSSTQVSECGSSIMVPAGQCVKFPDGHIVGTCSAPPPPPAVPAPPPMPAPQVSPSDRYSTANGVKSAHEIQTELLAAGYSGPFDVPSLLAAYQSTTNSPVRPL